MLSFFGSKHFTSNSSIMTPWKDYQICGVINFIYFIYLFRLFLKKFIMN